MQNTVHSYAELAKLSDDAPYYFYGEHTYTSGWKMHLFLNKVDNLFPDLHDQTIKELSRFLMAENLEHKFKNGCDDLNTFCIYVGSRDACEQLAQKLIAKFGKKFQAIAPQGNHFSGSDENMFDNPNIGIRFDGVNEKLPNSPFLRYGEKGIPGFLHRQYLAAAVLGKDVTSAQEDNLKKVACHLILAKYCGENYLGKNYQTKPWDQQLFDKVSAFSAEDIKTYMQKCIAVFNPEKYIKPTSLSSNGYDIDVDEKMKLTAHNQQQNKIFSDHVFSGGRNRL